MSETRFNIVDKEGVVEGIVHASVIDSCVAALSAEPETFAELEDALTRFVRPIDNQRLLAFLHPTSGVNTESWDAGNAIIDLSAQLVAVESTYSEPQPEGSVKYHDGCATTDLFIWYRVPDSWEFLRSIEPYEMRSAIRREALAECPRLDARAVIYGRPLLEFIVTEVRKLFLQVSDLGRKKTPELLSDEVTAIHAKWLTMPRDDLQNQSPRDHLVAQREFIDLDLQSREVQWSLQGGAPPCLNSASRAYRFSGFGTHENVIYYDLVRYLLWSTIEVHFDRAGGFTEAALAPDIPDGRDVDSIGAEILRLEKIRQEWWESPLGDYGRSPANIVQSERRRLPLIMRSEELILDPDCPTCVMSASDAAAGHGPGFLHFDSAHMEDEFAFSASATEAEWDDENRAREEFTRDFNRRWLEREARVAAGESAEVVDAELGFD